MGNSLMDIYQRCLLTTKGTTFGHRELLPEYDYAVTTVEHLASDYGLHVNWLDGYSGEFIRWDRRGHNHHAGTFKIQTPKGMNNGR